MRVEPVELGGSYQHVDSCRSNSPLSKPANIQSRRLIASSLFAFPLDRLISEHAVQGVSSQYRGIPVHCVRRTSAGLPHYRQPGSRTSPSIQRQVRTKVPARAVSGVRLVIGRPSTGRSGGRSPGRRGGETSRAKLSSHQVQAQGSQERLPGLAAVSCGACGPPLKFPDISFPRSYPKDITSLYGNKAAVTGNRSSFSCLTFGRPDRH